jgi:DNA end-binding protein Ku
MDFAIQAGRGVDIYTDRGNATSKLERLSAPFSGVVPGLPVAGDGADETHPPTPSLASYIPDQEDDLSEAINGPDVPGRPTQRLPLDEVEDHAERIRPATRITLRPHDPSTGEKVGKDEVVRGYEYERGQYVTFTPEELKALDLESSKVIDLEMFVPRGEVAPVYFKSPYYLYPEGQTAVEAIRVIGAAMADAGVVGIGRLTMSRRERLVVVDPRGTGMVLNTLRAAEEVRAPQFTRSGDVIDAEMLAIARAIIGQRTGKFDPSTFRDRYQEALRELIGAKMKGLPIKPREISTSAPVIDLMAALKRSLEEHDPVKLKHNRR